MYGDLDFLADDGRLWPLAFPAFDYERMLEQGYCAHLFAVRRDALIAAIEARPDNLYRLFNSLLDQTGPLQADILHLPERWRPCQSSIGQKPARLLSAASHLHLRARGIDANVTERHGNFFPRGSNQAAVSKQRGDGDHPDARPRFPPANLP